MKTFIMTYDLVADFETKKEEYARSHSAYAGRAASEGIMLLEGPLTSPEDVYALVFHAGDARRVEAFAVEDPYVRGGLVTKYVVREWDVIAGIMKEAMLK